jgi:hypothetical protein
VAKLAKRPDILLFAREAARSRPPRWANMPHIVPLPAAGAHRPARRQTTAFARLSFP